MDTDTTKAMQEALQAAVTRMNGNGSTSLLEPKPFGGDMIGVVMSVLSKLLQGSESSEALVDKLDALQKGELASLREDLQMVRKQSFRIRKSQEQLFLKVEEIQREQANVARAVLDLAHHMARITFIDDGAEVDDDGDRDVLRGSDGYRRAPSRGNGNGNGSGPGRRPRGTSDEHGSTSRAGRAR